MHLHMPECLFLTLFFFHWNKVYLGIGGTVTRAFLQFDFLKPMCVKFIILIHFKLYGTF